MSIEAVLWDFGGVLTSSPFEAFNQYEAELGLPPGFIRRLNSVDPDHNAWARLERGELTPEAFAPAFEAEARALGGELSGRRVLELIHGRLRPEMVEALRRVRRRYRVACITNRPAGGAAPALPPAQAAELERVFALFELVVDSSRLGLRKPDPAIYRHACARLGVAPAACVYLDDLGINCKPARALGMHTIKVESPAQAIAELQALLGLELR